MTPKDIMAIEEHAKGTVTITWDKCHSMRRFLITTTSHEGVQFSAIKAADDDIKPIAIMDPFELKITAFKSLEQMCDFLKVAPRDIVWIDGEQKHG